MPRPLLHPAFWMAAFVLWSATLWMLSASSPSFQGAPKIPHLDKIAHFGYFFGGAGLLAAFFFRLNPQRPDWRKIIGLTVVILAIVGALDEYHQTFTPGRSGNDRFDWLADLIGAIVGSLTFKRFHRAIS